MTRRILIAAMKQETATFNPFPTLYDDFQISRGRQLVTESRGTNTEIAGALDVFEQHGRLEIVPAVSATAVSGGAIPPADLDRLTGEIIESVRAAGNIDAAYLCFHGAMAGVEEPDPEGRLLGEIRRLIGDVPVVVSLDLHAIITDDLVARSDVLVPYHTYPHTDHYETGQRAATVLLQLLEGTTRPTVARVELPMLVRGDDLITETGRFGEAIRMCQDIEQSTDGLAAGVIIGNAFTDVPALQSNVLVTTNQNPELAEREAERIGRFMWKNREFFQAELTALDNAISMAGQTDGLTVFSDGADATASGASGDSNIILKGLLKSGFTKDALVPIVDATAVETAFDAGVSGEISVSLGGTRDPGRFQPICVKARVRSLHDGQFTYENGTQGRAGRTAVLICRTLSILVTERTVFVVGRRVFQSHGLDPRDFDLVVVKSPNGFRTWYEDIASLIVPVDVPGSTSANLKSLPFTRCVRPIFPLDDSVPDPF